VKSKFIERIIINVAIVIVVVAAAKKGGFLSIIVAIEGIISDITEDLLLFSTRGFHMLIFICVDEILLDQEGKPRLFDFFDIPICCWKHFTKKSID